MDSQSDRARKLFHSVVTQAVVDATSQIEVSTSPVKRRKGEGMKEFQKRRQATTSARESRARLERLARQQARDWLLGNSEDFKEVCELAGYEPEYVRNRATMLAENDWNALRALAA